MIKTSFYCLFIALALNVAFTQTQTLKFNGEPPLPLSWVRMSDDKKALEIHCDHFGTWLKVLWSGGKDNLQWHPNWTSITTTYKPVVKKKAHGQWEVVFTSELTERLP